MKQILLLIFPFFLAAQDVKIGSWKNYLSYNSASHIAESNNNIYCVASGSLFYVNKIDKSISRMSKVNGLSDIDVSHVLYSHDLNILIVTYQNCNIDIIKNNEIINISDIKRKEVVGLKKINNIIIKNNTAYLATSIGLILVDLEKLEIKDTYNIRESTENIKINGCAFKGDTIMVATSNGLYFAESSNSNLSDYNSWNAYNNRFIEYDNVLFYNNTLFLDTLNNVISISYNRNTLLTTYKDSICINNTTCFSNENFENIKYAWKGENSKIWVADSVNGLLSYNDYTFETSYIPQGPVSNKLFSINFSNENLYQCHGGHTNYSSNLGIKNGVSVKNIFDEWINYDRNVLGNMKDVVRVAVNEEAQYYGSWNYGIAKMQQGNLIQKYGYENTNGALDTAYYSSDRIRISDLKFDANGNLWGLNSEVSNPLFVKTTNEEWYSYSMNQDRVGLFFDNLIIDDHNQKWGIIGRGGGLFVYNDNNTINNSLDDNYKILNTNLGFGNLPSMWVYSIEKDLDGSIWIGTKNGVGVFYNPLAVFSNYNFDSQQILIQEGDYGQYLLSEEKVTSIKVDPANRKWLGTEKSGVFLVSEDGLTQLLHFTSENSPLLSNNIIDIAINYENGEVFFGTQKGIVSYRSDATSAATTQAKTHVYPNPVRENYNGPIAIKGLVSNANIKITDSNGNLVFEGYANGGQAIWDGKNKEKNRVGTGVYLVFSSDVTGQEKIVSKILFIR